ncbi:uncharacterized protein EAF02_003655 [Botrytis sinoallii]|uniref:uncharacterized protein n=1 Tax=Botrytis sinoallii TaxID=1463999 RepID=UPI0018FFDA9C|nr:uncharacterized protein EAF02_003655 [Botrytis sinoallii]KAF7887008.1 hypothetical protein EAF02_003655 [Botrytis sinoallii]
MLFPQFNPIAPATSNKMYEKIVHKTLKGRVTKNIKKTVTSPKKQVSSPDEMMSNSKPTSATPPNRPIRLIHYPLSKQQATLLRRIKTSLKKSSNPVERVEPKQDQMDLDRKIEYTFETKTSGRIQTKKLGKSEKPVFKSKFAKETTFSGVVKNKKEAKPVLLPNFPKYPKSPLAISESRVLQRPNGKGLVALGREVVRFGVANVLRSLESDAMDTVSIHSCVPYKLLVVSLVYREDYDWNYDGFNGYLLEEHRAKCVQFPEMDLEPETLILYYKGEVNEYGIA